MNRVFRSRVRIALVCLLMLSFAGYVKADEVTDSLQEAIKQYEKGEYPAAIENVDYAAQIIRQKRAEDLESFLPGALPGWSAQAPTSRTISAAMLGGGVFVERQYIKDYSVVTVQIATDSPMLQGVMSMFSNQMFLTASGAKIDRIKGQKAIVSYNPTNGTGDIKVIVANRVLVTISGQAVSQADLVDYANNVDYGKLNSLF